MNLADYLLFFVFAVMIAAIAYGTGREQEKAKWNDAIEEVYKKHLLRRYEGSLNPGVVKRTTLDDFRKDLKVLIETENSSEIVGNSRNSRNSSR